MGRVLRVKRPCPWAGWGGMLGVSLCYVPVGGETEEEKIYVDILENEIMDRRLSLAKICYSSEFVSLLFCGAVTVD